MCLRLVYYMVAAPILFILRLIFFSIKVLFKVIILTWEMIWRYQKLRKADFDKMNGWEFEEYVAKLLRANGFSHVEVTSGSGDQGVDVLAMKEETSYAIQCKNYTGKIPNKAVQEAYAGAKFYGCDIPVVLTNRSFYPSAFELADEVGVELWDREELLKLRRIGR